MLACQLPPPWERHLGSEEYKVERSDLTPVQVRELAKYVKELK
jgi:hypothetical protein